MKQKTQLVVTVVALTCVATATAFLLHPSFATARAQGSQTNERQQAREEQSVLASEERATAMKPAVDMAVIGDYSGALKEFENLQSNGMNGLVLQRARCLFHLHRAKEGLQLLTSAPTDSMSIEIRTRWQVPLALAAGDKDALAAALSQRERIARAGLADAEKRVATFDQRIDVRTIPVTKRLLAIAVELGRSYDREAMYLVSEEALRKGDEDAESLIQLASVAASNGDLRRSMSLYERARGIATEQDQRKLVDTALYDLGNIVHLVTRDRSIQQEEDRRHREYAEKHGRMFWN
jgi:tetratricopeptide (TPR) repeat protein